MTSAASRFTLLPTILPSGWALPLYTGNCPRSTAEAGFFCCATFLLPKMRVSTDTRRPASWRKKCSTSGPTGSGRVGAVARSETPLGKRLGDRFPEPAVSLPHSATGQQGGHQDVAPQVALRLG